MSLSTATKLYSWPPVLPRLPPPKSDDAAVNGLACDGSGKLSAGLSVVSLLPTAMIAFCVDGDVVVDDDGSGACILSYTFKALLKVLKQGQHLQCLDFGGYRSACWQHAKPLQPQFPSSHVVRYTMFQLQIEYQHRTNMQ